MKIKSSVLSDLLKVLSGNIVAHGLGFIVIMIMSRGLGPEKYGVYAIFISIYDFLRQFADLGISTAYVKLCSQKITNNESVKDIFITAMLSKVIISIALIVTSFFCSSWISIYFFGNDIYSDLIVLITISVLFSQIFNVMVIHLQALQKFKLYSYLNISNQVIRLITIVALASYFTFDRIENFVIGFVFSYTLICIMVGVKYFRYFFKADRGRFSLTELKKIYQMGFWVFLSGIAVVLTLRLDVWMLKKMSNNLEVGYYSVAMQLAMVFPLLTMSIQSTLLPKVGEYLKKNTIREYIFKILSFSKYVFVVFVILLWLSPDIIEMIFSNRFKDSVYSFRILLSAVIIGIFLNPISLVFYCMDKAHYLTVLNWLQLLFNIILNLFLIPLYGAPGASLSTLIVRIVGIVFILGALKNLSRRGFGKFNEES